MAEQYKPGNRFSERVTVAQAAVEWQGLTQEQQSLTVVDDGTPFLIGVPDLTDRADALVEAALSGRITGRAVNEDGYPLRRDAIRLDRASVQGFVDEIDERTQTGRSDAGGDAFLRLNEVCKRLGLSRATVYRRLKEGSIEQAHVDAPPRWRQSYIESLVANPQCTAANDSAC